MLCLTLRKTLHTMLHKRSVLIVYALFLAATMQVSASAGLITKPSSYSAKETLKRLEGSLEERGFSIFTRLDHAAAAESVGLKMPYSTVLVFGKPLLGTPNFIKYPKLAIDLPLKAHVWEDENGKVWLSYNSSEYLTTIYDRHGAQRNPEAIARLEKALSVISDEVVQ